jgi:hypothetical protein
MEWTEKNSQEHLEIVTREGTAWAFLLLLTWAHWGNQIRSWTLSFYRLGHKLKKTKSASLASSKNRDNFLVINLTRRTDRLTLFPDLTINRDFVFLYRSLSYYYCSTT